MYEIFEQLLEKHGVTAYKVSKETGISTATLSDWKKGRSVPKNDKLQKIASYFNVPLEFLLGKSGLVDCPECGLSYVPSDISDCKEHETYHQQYLAAAKHYGFFYPGSLTEVEKNKNLNAAVNYDLDFEKRVNAWIEVIRAYFSRSLQGNNYELNHPQFDVFASMLLNTDSFKKRISDDAVYNRLTNMYGRSEGLPEGESYYHVKEDKEIHTIAAHKENNENWTLKELKRIDEYKQLLLAARNNRK